MSAPPAISPAAPALPTALVCKTGVMLGRLSTLEREWTLALASHRLPAGAVLAEAAVNPLLKAALAEELAFLDLDHVELRRWLVDAGWWQRDAYGRAYQRVDLSALAPAQAAMRSALDTVGNPAAWAASVRQQAETAKAAKRAAWLKAQAGASADAAQGAP